MFSPLAGVGPTRKQIDWAIGLDLGGTALKFGLVSNEGRIVCFDRLESLAVEGVDAVLNQMHVAIGRLLNNARSIGVTPIALGLACPGTVDSRTGIAGGALPNMPGWAGVRIVERLEKESELPSYADNDANLMALAEAIYGQGANVDSVFGVTLGTGIGGGIIIDGKIYRGAGSAGEIGHVTVVSGGRSCPCGKRGCLERYASGPSLSHEYENQTGVRSSPDEILSLWLHGNSSAIAVVDRFAGYLGLGLGMALDLLHPSCLVLGGGLMGAGEPLLRRLENEIRKNCLAEVANTVSIKSASMGNSAGVVGAATLAFSGIDGPLTEGETAVQ